MNTAYFESSAMSRRISCFLLFLMLSLFATACDKKDKEKATEGAASDTVEQKVEALEKPKLVATTTMLTDLAAQLAGDDFEVKGIMTPGADPHLYKPKPSDAAMISESNVVLTSGFHLEGWIDRLMKNAGGAEKIYIVAVDGQKPRKVEGFPHAEDPHFWFDLKRWGEAAKHVGSELQRVPNVSDDAKKRVSERLAKYIEETNKTDAWARKQLATIPEKHRVLVTSHDAFGYFGQAYDMKVEGVQGLSTEQEASQRDVANVIDLVNKLGTPAVFFETSTNPNLTKQVSRETNAKLAGPLYSDSIGAPDSPANTFLKTFRENIRMIVEGLGGKYEPYSSTQ